jgi:6-pyruvoyl-tetrahydropterin synthase
MYKTGIKADFKVRHKLIGDFGDETLPHEHVYVLEWMCGVSELDENGFGVNIDILNEKLEKVIHSLDGVFLNDLPYFQNRQASIENTAHYICSTLYDELKNEGYPINSITDSEIKIWESDIAWASYNESWS